MLFPRPLRPCATKQIATQVLKRLLFKSLNVATESHGPQGPFTTWLAASNELLSGSAFADQVAPWGALPFFVVRSRREVHPRRIFMKLGVHSPDGTAQA